MMITAPAGNPSSSVEVATSPIWSPLQPSVQPGLPDPAAVGGADIGDGAFVGASVAEVDGADVGWAPGVLEVGLRGGRVMGDAVQQGCLGGVWCVASKVELLS